MARALAAGVVVGLALVVGLMMASPSTVLQAIGDFLVVRDPPAKVDVIIAISGDGTGERARAAARLVREGYGTWLMVSGSRSAVRHMLEAALGEGIPRGRILIEGRSESTRDNARNTAELVVRHGWKRAIVVTSTYHSRRAAWIFRAEFVPRGLDVRVIAANNSYFDMHRWWTREVERTFVLREYAKLAAFLVGIR